MPYKISSQEQLSSICKIIETFDEKTQKIVVKKTTDGVYYPALAPRSRGIKWFFEAITSWITTPKVNKCMQNFILENEEQFLKYQINPERIIRNFVKYDKTSSEVKKILNTLSFVANRHLNVTTDALERAYELRNKSEKESKEKLNKATIEAAQFVSLAEAEVSALKKQAEEIKASHQALINKSQIDPISKKLRESPGDFTINCSGGKVTAHKLILSAYQDSMFYPLLHGQFEKKNELNLTEYSKKTVELCLDLLYGSISMKEVSIEDLIELYSLVDFLNLKELKKTAEEAILSYAKENSDMAFNLIETFSEGERTGSLPRMEKNFYIVLANQVLEDVKKGKTKALEAIFLFSNAKIPVAFDGKRILVEGLNFEDFNALSKEQKANLLEFIKRENPHYIFFIDFIKELCESTLNLNDSLLKLITGLQYFFCSRTEKSKEDGKKMIEEALKAGIELEKLPGSIVNWVGTFYYTNQDHYKAFQAFQIAASKSNGYGLRNVGFCYQNGRGVGLVNLPEAKKYYLLAAEKGISLPLIDVGKIETDKTLAGEYFMRALSSNDPRFRFLVLFEAGKFFYASPDPTIKQEGLNYLLEAAKEKFEEAIKFLKDNNISIP